MAAKKNPLSDKAYEMYKQGMKLVDIATDLDVPPGTVRRWKSTHGWDSERSECDTSKKSERSGKKRTEKKPTIDDGTRETLQNEDLTAEQQMFCIYYSRTFNAAQSYQKAYGCSYQTAMVEGCKSLRKPKVRAEIERLKEIKRQQIVASADDIVELQMRIAFGDIGMALGFGQDDMELKDGSTIKVNVMRLKESDQVDTQLIQSVTEGRGGVSITMKDSQKAIDWLTKYFLMHPESKYRAEYERKRAEVKDNAGEEILKNMQTIADILKNPVANRTIEDFEEKADE